MGDKLVEFYVKAEQMGGFKAKMRLAVITKIPSNKAQSEPDTPENVAKFNDAMTKLKQEFN